ncbi:unnamed protein product [Fusarium langsethiae]|nr:unnamed protein product [Fusarium langsethiae]
MISNIETHKKNLEARKLLAESQLSFHKSREESSRATRSKYADILRDLEDVKDRLSCQKAVLEKAKCFAHKAQKELTNVSDKWYKLVGIIGILNNRLGNIEEKVSADFIPSIVDISDLIVRAANQGCCFLQWDGVEAELKAALEKIQIANDWENGNDQVKTLKKNLQTVRGLIDATIHQLPLHANDGSWFPESLPLAHGTEEM